jgi:ring-1,2-phenylacetyl-CoA epoxidase subunit PaaC
VTSLDIDLEIDVDIDLDKDHGTPDPSHEEGSVYDALLGGDPSHWAFGTDFEDPLAGVDTTVPAGLDAAELAAYCLALGDDALVMSHRLSEWCSNAPDLEDDIALANIALDLLGQARLLLSRAAAADPAVVPVLPEGSPVPAEDALAFFRDAPDFHNVRLVEVPGGDFGLTIARLLLFATARFAAFERLSSHADPVLAAIAAKGVKELAYHRDYAGRWFVTLAQGTEESRSRLLAGLAEVWPLHHELVAAYDVGADADAVLDQVFEAAGVERPEVGPMYGGGHTEALSRMLAEMQVVARAHPMGLW